jgi:hypothetical protein
MAVRPSLHPEHHPTQEELTMHGPTRTLRPELRAEGEGAAVLDHDKARGSEPQPAVPEAKAWADEDVTVTLPRTVWAQVAEAIPSGRSEALDQAFVGIASAISSCAGKSH